MRQILQSETRPTARFSFTETQDVHQAGALGFMPRIFVLTTLPHRRPETHRFEKVNGRYSLQLEARRSVGIPYGFYPRLILVYLTTQAVRTKSAEIDLGRTPSDFARKLGLTPISGPRGTLTRLRCQLQRLSSTRLNWHYTKDFRNRESGCGSILGGDSILRRLSTRLLMRWPSWSPTLVMSSEFFREITRSAVPVDLRAIQQLKRSPLAIDIYVWLTYRMSYLRWPCLISWAALENQFGCNYARPRDFRRGFLACLGKVIRVYPSVRFGHTGTGLYLYPSPPQVKARRR